MSEYSLPEQRTEMPTARRWQEIRKEGSMFHSHEVEQCASLMIGYIMLSALWGYFYTDLKLIFVKSFKMIANPTELDFYNLWRGFISLLILIGPHMLIFILGIATVGYFSVMLQTKFCVRAKKVKFNWGFINPIGGLMKIVSPMGLLNTAKSCLKLILILPIGYLALKRFAPQMIRLMHLQILDVFTFTGTAMGIIFWRILYVLIALAIFDYVYGRYRWYRTNKMTKEEVKDERKAVEGDETTKKQIQAKGFQRLMMRIQSSVRKADVVVTNPTHFAVALQYDRGSMDAPIVVAKGRGYMALRIREIAKEAGVPVLERKPLARALYASVEVGKQIPRDLFRAVAEVLAYVYKLKNPYGTMQQAKR